MNKEYRIDPELKSIMSELAEDEKNTLEKSLLQDGYKGPPIVVWKDTIIDGHNRYELCRKHNIPFEVQEMQFDSKDEVIQWMIRAQIGRRNLSKAQRCALVRRFRPIYEKEAKENQIKAGGDKKSEEYKRTVTAKLPQANDASKGRNPTTNQKLAELANVSERTFRMCDKVLNSDNEGLKEDMLSDKKTINASYKELQRLEKEGHKMDIPEQVKESASNLVNEKKFESEEEHISVEAHLSRIKKDNSYVMENIPDNINWLLQKEYIGVNGQDITSRIHTELNGYLDNFQKFQDLITIMCPDECGDENVIQIK